MDRLPDLVWSEILSFSSTGDALAVKKTFRRGHELTLAEFGGRVVTIHLLSWRAMVWDLGTKRRETLDFDIWGMGGCAVHGALIAAGSKSEIRRFDGSLAVSLGSSQVFGCAFSLDGRRLATANWGSARIWDVDSGSLVVEIDHTDLIAESCVAFMGGDEDDDANYEKDLRVNACEFLGTNGERLATRSDRLRIFDSTTAALHFTNPSHHGMTALSTDGTRAVLVSRDNLELWSFFNGSDDPPSVLYVYSGVTRNLIWSLTFAPAGGRVAGICTDHRIRVWDATNPSSHDGGLLLSIDDPYATSIAFSHNGKLLVTMHCHKGDDRFTTVWDAVTGSCYGSTHYNYSPGATFAVAPPVSSTNNTGVRE